MKNFASTIGTTGLLVGLMVAAHLVIVSRREPDAPRPKPVVVSALPEAVSTWSDPPARIEQHVVAPQADVAAPAPAMVQTAAWMESPALPEPRVETPPARHVSLDAGKAKRAEQARRARIAQKARASRIASRNPAPEQTDATAASRAEPASAQRIDPIGDILRGLGIGGQG